MISLRQIHSLTHFLRNHKEHMKRLSEGRLPEVLTVNGKPALVVQSAEGYQDMLDRLEHAEKVAGLRKAYKQVQDGEVVPFEAGFKELRTRHGI